MKAIILSALLAPCLSVMGQGMGAPQKKPLPMNAIEQQLSISVKGDHYKEAAISDEPVTVSFHNRSADPIYLLDQFTVNGVLFAFQLIIADAKGNTIMHYTPHIKVEMTRPLRYIALEPGEIYTLSLDLPEIIKETDPNKLLPGNYTLTIIYENKLGNRCFKGKLESQPIKLTVAK